MFYAVCCVWCAVRKISPPTLYPPLARGIGGAGPPTTDPPPLIPTSLHTNTHTHALARQFTRTLDLLEEWLNGRGLGYMRIDGTVSGERLGREGGKGGRGGGGGAGVGS